METSEAGTALDAVAGLAASWGPRPRPQRAWRLRQSDGTSASNPMSHAPSPEVQPPLGGRWESGLHLCSVQKKFSGQSSPELHRVGMPTVPGSPSPGWVPTLPVAEPPPVLLAVLPPPLPDAAEPLLADEVPPDEPPALDAEPVDPESLPDPLLEPPLLPAAVAWHTSASSRGVGNRASGA